MRPRSPASSRAARSLPRREAPPSITSGDSSRRDRGQKPLQLFAGDDLGLDEVVRLSGWRRRTSLCAGREKNCSRPGWNEVETRHEFGEKRRQEGPMPPDEPCHREGHEQVERVVPGRGGSRREERKQDDLYDVRGNPDQARRDNAPCRRDALAWHHDLPRLRGRMINWALWESFRRRQEKRG